jgi:glycerol-3-phosphate dehydrogenase
MKRSLEQFDNELFDVLIIGGGIHGAATAKECSCRGLKTALIEKNDFGGETSANSLKIIHGGLRYLQHLNIKRMRESVISRRIMSRLAPHYVKPLGCVIANTGCSLRSNLLMWIALKLNDCIAIDRNKGLEKQCWIPGGRIIPLTRCKELFPAVDWTGMTGGSSWFDAIAQNTERLTLTFIKEAVQNGAKVANYVKMQNFLIQNGTVAGCVAVDTLHNHSVTINARVVVITGGPWNNSLLEKANIADKKHPHWAKAINIIVRKPLFPQYAIGLTGEADYQDQDSILKKKGRFFFFVPWRGYTMIGTTYKKIDHPPGQVKAEKRDIDEFIAEVNSIYPAAQLTFGDVTNVHAGLVPMSSHHGDKNGEIQLEKETTIMTYGSGIDNLKGLITVKSVKFTTAPVVAMETCSKIIDLIKKKSKSQPAQKPLLFLESSVSQTSSPQFAYLQERYDKDYLNVLQYVMKNAEMVSINPPLCLGEIDYFLQQEMAFKVSDVVFRRSELATADCPTDAVLRQISTYMGKKLGWNQQQIDAEIQEVQDHFCWN